MAKMPEAGQQERQALNSVEALAALAHDDERFPAAAALANLHVGLAIVANLREARFVGDYICDAIRGGR